MKRLAGMVAVLTLVCLGSLAGRDPKPVAPNPEIITKTYALRYIPPVEAERALRAFLLNSSFSTERSLLTVSILRRHQAEFEDTLRRLDVERRSVFFRVFAVVATAGGRDDTLAMPLDLKRVLGELSRLMNFQRFRLDGVNAATAREGGGAKLALAGTGSPLSLTLSEVGIGRPTAGVREIRCHLLLTQGDRPLIESDGTLREDGYLVAGVSRLGQGDSLVLVIHAVVR